MGNSAARAIQTVVETLLADSTVVGLVSNRVLASNAMDTSDPDPTFPRVVISLVGGFGSYFDAAQTLLVEVAAGSRVSSSQALEVYDACKNALQAARLLADDGGATLGGYARETARPRDGWDEASRVHWAGGSWTLIFGG